MILNFSNPSFYSNIIFWKYINDNKNNNNTNNSCYIFFQNLLNLLFLFSISFEFVIRFYVVCKPRSRSAHKDKARCVGLLTKLCEP